MLVLRVVLLRTVLKIGPTIKNPLGKRATLPENNTLPNERISNTLDIDTSPFSMAELPTATKQLKSSIAFGPDNIPAIIWKDRHFQKLLLNLTIHFLPMFAPKSG